MVTREQVELLTLVWTIFIATVGFLSKIIHSYITESVSERECYNTDEAFFLVLGELIGCLIVHTGAFLLTLILGDIVQIGISGWALYFRCWLVLSAVYIIAIIIILLKKMEKGSRQWIGNVTLGMMVNIILWADLYASQSENYTGLNTLVFILLVLGIMALQVLYNLKTKVVREIEYRVKVKGRSTPYKFQTKPRKTGNFFSARMLDEEHKETKRMLLPESEIEKIEYIIKEKRG